MSDTDRFGTSVAQEKDTIEGTWSIDGQEFALITEDTAKGTLNTIDEYLKVAAQIDAAEGPDDIPDDVVEDLPDFPWEDENEDIDFIESVLKEKLKKPDIDIEETPTRKLSALFEGMMEAWGEGTKVTEAKEEMPIDKGNA